MQGNIEAEQEAARKKAEQEAEEAAERERQQVGCCLRGVFGTPGVLRLQGCWENRAAGCSGPASWLSVFRWPGTIVGFSLALQAEEAERLAAEAAEKLALEQASTDPNVWAIRTMINGTLGAGGWGCSKRRGLQQNSEGDKCRGWNRGRTAHHQVLVFCHVLGPACTARSPAAARATSHM